MNIAPARSSVLSLALGRALLGATAALLVACKSAPPPEAPGDPQEVARWRALAERVTIERDTWGIPHVTGVRDADAVFGLMYAQCEDDFARVEGNLINALGRLAEVEGEKEIFRDLRMKLFIDPVELQALYGTSQPWLRALMDAWADGLNFYLYTHPQVKPRLIERFEPWMALSFSEGSIGGDIERISLDELAAFYAQGGAGPKVVSAPPSPATAPARWQPSPLAPPGIRVTRRGPPDPLAEPTGSNGFAIAPSRSATGHPLLLINPHTSFFFREEAQVRSGEGLNAYGALTWGQFFVYQGFNEAAGWMHTSSGVDNIDEYLETIVDDRGVLFVRRRGQLVPITAKQVRVPYRTDTGMANRELTVYRTSHGPIVRAATGADAGKWVAIALMHKPVEALSQSFLRTKARNYEQFVEVMRLHANSSNNTVFADAEGNIAYLHSNFVPRRDPSFDWTQPVDGADPRAAWNGVHTVEETPNVRNPPVGWIQNTNNWPYSSAGPDSPKAERFAAYFDTFGENPRGDNAVRVLSAQPSFTLESLIAAAYDPRMAELEAQVPLLVKAWHEAAGDPALLERTAEAIALLDAWDHRWSVASVPTSLAVLWAELLWKESVEPARAARVSGYVWMRTRVSAQRRLAALGEVMAQLEKDFGTWKKPWGDLNRYQRRTADLEQPFSDFDPSIPVAFAPGRWGSLASFVAQPYKGSKKRYGTSGNSFVAVVELTPKGPRALAVTAGGLSSDVTSKHFGDQAARYARGELREVYFDAEKLAEHLERSYRPGELAPPLRNAPAIPAR
jgi:acyl-homoserine-lactone acylase